MAKNKTHDEHEHLRGIIRNLKAEVKHLKKELTRYEKRTQNYHDLEERQAEEEISKFKDPLPPSTKNTCPKCGSNLIELDIEVKTLVRCEKCDYRKTMKKC